MRLIAVRDETEAWADEPFDPETDNVTLRIRGHPDTVVRWQSALKFGYWESPSVLAAAYARYVEEFYNKNHDKAGRFASSGTFKVITAAQARGDSRPVSHAEFQRLAGEGQKQLDGMAERASTLGGLRNFDKIKREAYDEVRKPWGGATIDLHTGEALPQGANAFAITVKGKGGKTVSVPENVTPQEFSDAMDRAIAQFMPILRREGHHLGVFHDDENGRIDIDPVIVVHNRADVDTIGAASHAIGGAYNFADGNGYWPPHVAGE